MRTLQSSETRLDFRLTQENKELVEQAAALTGQTVSSFAISTLVEHARRIVQESSVTVLSSRDREAFLAMLDVEAGPNEALTQAAKRFKQR
jgi:uncharacterized protein (DUF1778 family)